MLHGASAEEVNATRMLDHIGDNAGDSFDEASTVMRALVGPKGCHRRSEPFEGATRAHVTDVSARGLADEGSRLAASASPARTIQRAVLSIRSFAASGERFSTSR